MYKGHLEEAGVSADNYRGHFLKSCLIRQFGDRLTFHRPCRRNETQYVFSSAVPPGPLIEFIKRQTESEGMSVDDENTPTCIIDTESQTIYAAAMIIRQTLLDLKNEIPFPPAPTDLSESSLNIPTALFNLLCWVIKGDDSIDTITTDTPVTLTDVATKRRVSSIAQDIIFSATSGRVKQPKHIALSMTIKSMMGSAEVITMLNRFCHSISLSQLRECDTAMANRQIETTHQGGNACPIQYKTEFLCNVLLGQQ